MTARTSLVLLAAAGLAVFAPNTARTSEPSAGGQVVQTALRLAALGETRLPADYIAAHGSAVPIGRGPAMIEARRLLRELERRFIHDPEMSSLDLLPPAERATYKAYTWDDADYPGGPEGPNEAIVLEMDEALGWVRPERRANSTSAGVVIQSEFDDAMWEAIQARRTPVPGQEPRALDRDALVSFLMMREAAKRDGVDIVILSSDRLPEVAARNAERAANPYATARFSSHILGLAMDLRLSQDTVRVNEVSTRPMSNIIAMRRSPVHKWLFLNGAAYGWYPYQHEPWHWEYNPPGFRERFWKAIGKPVPVR